MEKPEIHISGPLAREQALRDAALLAHGNHDQSTHGNWAHGEGEVVSEDYAEGAPSASEERALNKKSTKGGALNAEVRALIEAGKTEDEAVAFIEKIKGDMSKPCTNPYCHSDREDGPCPECKKPKFKPMTKDQMDSKGDYIYKQ